MTTPYLPLCLTNPEKRGAGNSAPAISTPPPAVGTTQPQDSLVKPPSIRGLSC